MRDPSPSEETEDYGDRGLQTAINPGNFSVCEQMGDSATNIHLEIQDSVQTLRKPGDSAKKQGTQVPRLGWLSSVSTDSNERCFQALKAEGLSSLI